jgi:peptidoglycan/xylan/chitin deacetylase (PgdA/CDA1 family)
MRPQYLLRFDDICPSMDWRVWEQVEAKLRDCDIAPVLGVIPDNQDPGLQLEAPNDRFWDRVRKWQARGWTIAMHGYQHRFVTKNSGLLKVNEFSEFAGLPRAEQEDKLRSGREILEREGIQSKVWIAPAHSFDITTVQLLSEMGFRYISDGFSLLPHVDSFGMTWIPQQLWTFRRRPFGVWTICFHINGWTPTEIAAFERSVTQYRKLISKFANVVDQYAGRGKTMIDSAAAQVYRSLALANSVVKQLLPSIEGRLSF